MENKLIQTKWKDKLPRELSYPVEAELVSQQLGDVPQYNDFEMSFSFWSGKMQHIIKNQIVYFMDVSFRRSEKSVSNTSKRSDSKWLKPEWRINVRPVPSKIRKNVREACINQGFPAIRKWLLKKRPDNWYFGYKKIELKYDVLNDKLKIELRDE